MNPSISDSQDHPEDEFLRYNFSKPKKLEDDIRSDEGGFHDFENYNDLDQVVEEKNQKNHDEVFFCQICSKIMDLLGQFTGGINISAFQDRYFAFYGVPLKFGKYAKSFYDFVKTRLKEQIKMIEKTPRGMKVSLG